MHARALPCLAALLAAAGLANAFSPSALLRGSPGNRGVAGQRLSPAQHGHGTPCILSGAIVSPWAPAGRGLAANRCSTRSPLAPPLRCQESPGASAGPADPATLPPGWDQFAGKTNEFFQDKYSDEKYQVEGFAGPVYSDVELQLAVVAGDVGKVTSLLEGGADVNEVNDRGWTALMYAAKVRNLELAKLLLERGADVTIADGFGNTAIHHASHFGAGKEEPELLKTLMEVAKANGFDTDTPNKVGMTALHWAGKAGHAGAASLLIAAGADVNKATIEGSTPLFEACSGQFDKIGGPEVADVLIEKGADINALEPTSGDTPLHVAVYMGVPEAAAALLKAGAKLDVKNKKGDTPMWMAAKGGDEVCVKILLDGGANADEAREDLGGRTALHEASKFGRSEVVECLIEAGANVNVVDAEGTTPLHDAAFWGRRRDDEEIAEALVAAGADKQAKNNKGQTPLDVAMEGTDPEDAENMYIIAALK